MTMYTPFLLMLLATVLMVPRQSFAQLCFDADWNVCNGVSTTLGVQGNWSRAVSGTMADLMSVSNTLSSQVVSLTNAVNGKFPTPTGTTSQYIQGNGALATFPTIPSTTTKTFNTPVRSVNSAFQISTTQDAEVVYTLDITVSSLLLAGAQGTVYLEYADNSGMTTNLVNVAQGTNSTSGVLNLTNAGTVTLTGTIPAGKYVRLRTQTNSGSPTFSSVRSQEVLQ